MGETRAKEVGPFLLDPVGATNPTLQEAREFTAQSTETARQLIDLIQHNWQIKTPRTDAVVNLDDLDLPSAQVGQKEDLPWKIENGWLTVDGKVLLGL